MNEIARSDPDTGDESTATNTETGGETDVERSSDGDSETVGRVAGDGAKTTQSRLPLDETFELLRNQRRRFVLQYLDESDGEASLSELAEHIAAWENDKDVRQITSSERKRVYVGLYQCHLPKMDGMGVVAFDKAKGSIRRRQRADALDPYLRPTGVPKRRSRTGPALALSVAVSTLLPVAILIVSQSLLSVAVAALVVSTATGWGIALLWHERADERPTSPEQATA